jgi:hypothetical protein
MVRSDIFVGLKNALDRGYSLEEAKKVLVDSGYDSAEVESVAYYITGGTGITPKDIGNKTPITSNYEEVKVTAPSTTSKGEIIFLVVFLVILFGLLILSFIFREKIIDFIKELI